MAFRDTIYLSQLKLRQSLIAFEQSKRGRQPRSSDVLFQPPSQLLFVLAGLLGDSVMSLPAIAAAREIWPEARITVLGKMHNRELLKADPNIDEFNVCGADPFSLRRSSEITELKSWLAGQEFDAAIILLGDQFAHLLAKAGIPVRVGVKGTILEPCLTHTYDIGSPREWGAKERLNCLRVLGADVQDRLPKLYVDPDAAESAADKLSQLGLPRGDRYIAFHPFGSTSRQWWPMEKIPGFVRQAETDDGIRVVLLGGKETQAAETGTERLIDTRGLLNIPELLAVIDGSELVVTTDSGPFHIAGALGKRIIGLFRDRRPEHAAAYPSAKIVFGMNNKCISECEWDKCAADPCRQMAAISVASVFSSVP
jgi:ADP-heptose:LPS heptosyltransferase